MSDGDRRTLTAASTEPLARLRAPSTRREVFVFPILQTRQAAVLVLVSWTLVRRGASSSLCTTCPQDEQIGAA